MEDVLIRLALFTLLPVLLGASLVLVDRTATGPLRRAEAFLIPLFLVGVGGGGIAGFIAHVFIAEPGSALERQVGFAHLAIGLLGAVASERRDGFREATVGAAAVFALGTALAHFLDGAGSLTPGSALLLVSPLVLPALLTGYVIALRRAEQAEDVNILLRGWMIPVRLGSVAAVAFAAAAFAVGNATGWVVASSLAGIAAAGVSFWWIVGRSATHRVRAGQSRRDKESPDAHHLG